ncbi:MAG: hypothetical protein WD208_10640 [Dehalococcoidia bacterium]
MRRYAQTLFRFKELVLIPLIAVPALALIVALYTGKEYEVEAIIWVDQNRFLETLTMSSPTRSTPSTVEGASLNEWFATKAFRMEVINRSGMAAAIENGNWPVPSKLGEQVAQVPIVRSIARALGVVMPVSPDEASNQAMNMMERQISVSAEGNNLLRARYVGKEPALGARLLEETLAYYNEKATDRQVADSQMEVEFYTRQVELQKERLDRAAGAEWSFLELYPEPMLGQTRPATELVELDRLRSAWQLEHTLYETALRKLEEVRIAGEAAVYGRNDSFAVVDPPVVPENAHVGIQALVMNLIVGVTLGGMIGGSAIVLLTWVDRTVRTREDVEDAVAVPLVAQVPQIGRGTRGKDWVRLALTDTFASTQGSFRRPLDEQWTR